MLVVDLFQMGIVAAFASDKAFVTCLEVNVASAKMAEKIIESLGLSDRIRVVVCDATKYQHDSKIDLVVSETMHFALTQEPMVQILENLESQLSENGKTIPKRVVLNAQLIDENKKPVRTSAFVYEPGGGDEIVFDLPFEGLPRAMYTFRIRTKIDLDIKNSLNGGDTIICLPFSLGKFDHSFESNGVRAKYRAGVDPDDIDVALY